MLHLDRFTGSIGQIELDFVEHEVTPEPLMKLSIHLHSAGLSLSGTVSVLDRFGVERARSTVHNWLGESRPTAGFRTRSGSRRG